MSSGVEIRQVHVVDADVLELIHEYQEVIQVIVRDSAKDLLKYVEPGSGIWLAYLNGQAVGCVCLRPLPIVEGASECKRLYVRPEARGHGLAHRLMDDLEAYAKASGYGWVYLDTHDGLPAAIALYDGRDYERCERYNDNPQATVFMRKAV